MALPARIQAFFDERKADYETVRHTPTFSARELAHEDHVPERKVAKTVVFLGDDVYAMAVLPSDERIAMEDLRHALGLKELRLATEAEMLDLFPDCEVGAVPPIGPLFDLPVYVDSRLTEQDRIEFNGGTHRDEIRMTYAEFARLAEPIVTKFGVHAPPG